MLDQLLNIIQNQSQEAIVNNPAVPNQQNEEAQNTILSSIVQGLQSEAGNGNLGGLLSMFSGRQGLAQNPIVANITQSAVSGLMGKLGINNQAAHSIVASVLPGVLSSLVSKINDPNDNSIDMNSAVGSVVANTTQNPQGFDFNMINNALADGKLDMNDLMSIGGSLLGGNSAGGNTGGGLGDLLGGFLGGKK